MRGSFARMVGRTGTSFLNLFWRNDARRWDRSYAAGHWSFLDGGDQSPRHRVIAGMLGLSGGAASRVLDVGCGTGALVGHLPGNVTRYVGIDISSEAIRVCHERRDGPADRTFQAISFDDYDPDERFNAIVFSEVLYYYPVRAIPDLLARAGELLAQGACTIIVSVHDRSLKRRPLWRRLHAWQRPAQRVEAVDPDTGASWRVEQYTVLGARAVPPSRKCPLDSKTIDTGMSVRRWGRSQPSTEEDRGLVISQSSSAPRVRTEVPGPGSRRLRERESHHIAPGFQAIAAYAGIAVDRGEGCDLIDVDGNRFLDLSASICVAALGYGHPTYRSALHDQLDRCHAGSFTTEARVHALEEVTKLAPEGLTRLQLYSGGAEAVESAMRLARAFTGKHETLSFWGGFHGKTTGALALMGSDFKHGLGPLPSGAHITPYADCACCPFGATYPECGLLCVEFAREKIKRETTGSLSAILVEPMQGTAGNVIPPPPFLPAVADVAREHDALLIVDEMITGFGRTGTMFGVEHSGAAPDIMTVGKSLGGGFPVSGVLAREEIVEARPWSNPSFSSSSYGGHPLAAAAVAASVSIILEEALVENAARVGAYLRDGLKALSERRPSVANVRGEGLFVGFDLVDEVGGFWGDARCKSLFQQLLRRGVISMAYAPRVRINPPLTFSVDEADEALAALDSALDAV